MGTTLKGGDKLIRKLQDMARSAPVVKAGVMADSPGGATYPDGKSAVMVAVIQEFGGEVTVTPKMRGWLAANLGIHLKKTTTRLVVPPRPFMRQTVKTHRADWVKRLGQLLRHGYSPEQALEEMGRTMMEDIQATIDDSPSWATPDSPLTLAQKESGKPLYHTGVLRGSIWYEVEA